MPAANKNQPNPDFDAPFFVHWDVTAMDEGDYCLRAVAAGNDGRRDSNPSFITVSIDNQHPDIEETYDPASGEYVKKQSVYKGRTNFVQIGGPDVNNVIELTIPENALNTENTKISIISNPGSQPPEAHRKAHACPCFEIVLENGQKTLDNDKQAQLRFPYRDEDKNGIIDGTDIKERDVAIHKYYEDRHRWEKIPNQETDYKNKVCVASLKGFSYFKLFQVLQENLSQARAYPNPCVAVKGHNWVKIDQISVDSSIQIFNIANELVWEIDGIKSGEAVWNLQNMCGKNVSSGVYLCYIKNTLGDKNVLKVVIIR